MRPVRQTVSGGTRRMPSFPVLRSLEAFLLSGFALVSQPKPVPHFCGTKLKDQLNEKIQFMAGVGQSVFRRQIPGDFVQ
jgi:hypothetical protein